MKTKKLLFNKNILYEAIGDERQFMLPMIDALKNVYNVKLIALVRFAQDKKYYKNTGLFDAVYSTSEMLNDIVINDLDSIKEAEKLEKKYKTVFHYNLCDRRLYFTGASSFPYTSVETDETYEGWIKQFVSIYKGTEKIFKKHNITITLNGRRVVTDIAKSLNLHIRSLGYSFLHDRMIWRDGMKVNGLWMSKTHKKMKKNNIMISANILEPPPFHMGVRRNFFDAIKFFNLIRIVFFIVLRTSYWHMRRYDKVTKFGYKASRHIRFNLRRRKVFQYLIRHSIKSDTLIDSEKPFVFMALQMEPETLLSSQTPEFYDQIAMIHQVSKELPVGTFLALKDHLPAIGYRDFNFYNMLKTMPNVILINPTDFALPLIKNSRAVVSLLGRTAFEAAALGVPVLSYSPNIFFSYLKHVHVCTDFSKIRNKLLTLLKYSASERSNFVREGKHLLAAMHSSTIDPAEYKDKKKLGKALLSSLQESLEKN